MHNPNYILIPIDLCFFSITNRFERPFQLYMHLKSKCDGVIKINSSELKEIANELGLKSTKTIQSNLKKLIQKNWIGYNENNGCYYVRGFDSLKLRESFTRRTAAEFDSKDIKKFKAFLAGAVIGYLAISQKRRKQRAEREMRRSNQALCNLSNYFPVAGMGLAKILSISCSKASRLKIDARKARYIRVKKNFNELTILANEAAHYKKVNPEAINKMRYRKQKMWEQLPDLVLPLIRFKRRKKMRTY
jgi:hypothetical protein